MNLFPERPQLPDAEAAGATLFVEGDREVRRELALRMVARWRAAELAAEIFGTPLDHRMSRGVGGGGFRGVLELEVPFHGLDDHREKEALFVAAARSDEVLGRMPLLYLFAPAARP